MVRLSKPRDSFLKLTDPSCPHFQAYCRTLIFATGNTLLFQRHDPLSRLRIVSQGALNGIIPVRLSQTAHGENAAHNDGYGNGSSRFLTRYFQKAGKFFPPVGFGQHRHVYRHTMLPR